MDELVEAQYENYLAHYGVLGMKWGVRRSPQQLARAAGRPIPRKTRREASKDAKEFTRAKMYYGEGAGTRRKLIKAKVNQKSKDSAYKEAFDKAVESTDMAKRASQARGQRKRTDISNSTKKTARGVGHILRGNEQYASLFAVGLMTAGTIAYKNGGDKYVKQTWNLGKTAWKNADAARKGRAFLKKNGF